MNIVIDTNIAFSAILNSQGLIGDLLFSPSSFDFFAPEFILEELTKYKAKLAKSAKISLVDVDITIYETLKNVELISPEAIAVNFWKEAFEFTHDIDEKDTPFVATVLALDGALWTGDKKLIRGLKNKGFQKVYSAAELSDMI